MIIRHRVGFSISKFSDGTRRIRARLSMPRQGRVSWWLTSKVDPSDVWDADASRFRRGSPLAAAANAEINDFATAVEEVVGRFELIEKRVPAMAELKKDVDEALGLAGAGDSMQLTASEVFEKYIAAHEKEWAYYSYKNAMITEKHLTRYAPDLLISDIDDDFLRGFMQHLTSVKGLKNTTMLKRIEITRFFLRWAFNNGYYSGNSHNTFRPRPKGVTAGSREIIYCTREEVHKLLEFKPAARWMERTLDAFLFCCFTGLRFSDVAKLRRCDIHGDEYISVVTQKTTDALRIELNARACAILKKYADDDAPIDAPAIPVPANCTANRLLKTIAKEAGIDAMTRVVYFKGTERFEEFKPKYELITFHCARRTFVVSALQLGIPPEVIMRWTGHSSYEAMKPYVAIVDELKRRSMDKFNLF